MIIIIDGYNLIKHANTTQMIGKADRKAFLKMISRYSKKKKHKLVVVFDGGDSSWPYREVVAGVVVIYSGSRETADSVIMSYIDDHHAEELLVVSSDNEIGCFAGQREVVSIGSEEFYYLLKEALWVQKNLSSDVLVEIDENIDDEDIDEIMEAASVRVPIKQEDMQRFQRSQKKRFSKRDRVLLEKLKKL